MDVVDAVQTVGVAELHIDRLVEVSIELCPERVDLTAGVLALVEVQREEVLQVVAAGVAGRRQHPAERPVEERGFDIVESVTGVSCHAGEPGSLREERCQQGVAREGVDHPEHDVGSGVGLHVHGDPPGLAAVVEDADLQVGRRRVVFALVPVGAASEHTVHDGHHALPWFVGCKAVRRHDDRGGSAPNL
jgi:hypothetical protein